jgi:chromosome segregation ATPase
MIKKLVIYGIVGVVGWHAIKDTKAGTWIRTELAGVRKAVNENTSPEKDLARIKTDIKLLDLDIQKQIRPLAAERVRVKELRETVGEQRVKLSQAKEVLQARATAIKSATEFVTFGNDKPIPVNIAKAELEEGVKQYTAAQKTLESQELTLASRERIKDGLEKQLEAMKTQKAELTAAVEALEAEVALLKLQQIESRHQTDNTRMARIKEEIRALKTKMDVTKEELKLLPSVLESSSATSSSSKSVDDIMAPLSGSKPTAAAGGKPGSMPPATD